MKLSAKAALFSALIFPGAGHLLLKKYLFGAILGTAALVPIYLVVVKAVERAQEIVDQILLGEINPDIVTILEMVSLQSARTDSTSLDIAMIALLVIWVVGIVDSYRLGRLHERTDSESS